MPTILEEDFKAVSELSDDELIDGRATPQAVDEFFGDNEHFKTANAHIIRALKQIAEVQQSAIESYRQAILAIDIEEGFPHGISMHDRKRKERLKEFLKQNQLKIIDNLIIIARRRTSFWLFGRLLEKRSREVISISHDTFSLGIREEGVTKTLPIIGKIFGPSGIGLDVVDHPNMLKIADNNIKLHYNPNQIAPIPGDGRYIHEGLRINNPSGSRLQDLVQQDKI